MKPIEMIKSQKEAILISFLNEKERYGFEDLQFEFQLRTILEEAWGEIDHKFRYVRSRNGVSFLEYKGSRII